MDVEQYPVVTNGAEDKDEKPNTPPALTKAEAIECGEHDLLHEENVDTVLTAKMALINDVSDPCNHTMEKKKKIKSMELNKHCCNRSRPSTRSDLQPTTGNSFA